MQLSKSHRDDDGRFSGARRELFAIADIDNAQLPTIRDCGDVAFARVSSESD